LKGLPPREMRLADPAFIELRSEANQAVMGGKERKGSEDGQ